jgi:hypothetical protein
MYFGQPRYIPPCLLGETEVRKHWSTKYYCIFTIQYWFTVEYIFMKYFASPASVLGQRINIYVFVLVGYILLFIYSTLDVCTVPGARTGTYPPPPSLLFYQAQGIVV